MNAVLEIIRQNIAAIVMGAILAFQSYTTNSTKTNEALVKIDDRLAKIETLQTQIPCVIRQLDRLNNGGNGPIPCDIGGK